jgi:hypothetical protein
MSVIGYVLTCDMCEVRMLVTTDARDSKLCPDCLDDYVQAAIDKAQADDDDYPITEVQG